MRSFNVQLESYFYYNWNSARRRAHILISILATLLALAVYAASPLHGSQAAPVTEPSVAVRNTLAALQSDDSVLEIVANGNDLYVGGTFSSIGGIAARGIARYNLQTGQWSALGNDLTATGNGVNGLISAIVIVGNDIYVGGSFTRGYNSASSNVSANCIARWNTQTKTWAALGTGSGPGGNGFDGDVGALVVHNGMIYAGGPYRVAHNGPGNDVTCNGIARWNPQTNTWSSLGKGVSVNTTSVGYVNDLALIGNDLYVGGSFNTVTNANDTKLNVDCIARWNLQSNTTWAVLGGGNGNGNNGVAGDVNALATDGTNLYVGGTFTEANNSTSNKISAAHVARWNGSTWSAVGGSGIGTGNNSGVNGTVWELYFNNGVLYVGGDFSAAFTGNTNTSANCIARWTGSNWAALGTGTGASANGLDQVVQVITAIGNMLYVGGDFTEAYNNAGNSVDTSMVARWNGSVWSALSPGIVKNVAVVSAASFNGTSFGVESIAAGYGTGLAATTQTATSVPLPTSLAGTTVTVKDSAGTTRQAQLFFVSAGQVNFLIPTGTVNGTATVTITASDNSQAVGDITIASVAPGLFTMNANGVGVVAGQALRVSGTTQTYETIASFNSSTGRWATKPIDLGPVTDRVFLILFGTGFRNRSSLSAVTVTIGGAPATVSFAGKQGGLIGVDQVNTEIPRSLIGRGEVDVVLTIDGKIANTVKINIQ